MSDLDFLKFYKISNYFSNNCTYCNFDLNGFNIEIVRGMRGHRLNIVRFKDYFCIINIRNYIPDLWNTIHVNQILYMRAVNKDEVFSVRYFFNDDIIHESYFNNFINEIS